eukprot:COSAG06_NODE_5879_length_3231_cov_1.840677_4_plen_361_part_00
MAGSSLSGDDVSDIQEICTTIGTDPVTAAEALRASGGDVHKAISALMSASLPNDSVDIVHYNEKTAQLEGSLLSWEQTFSLDTLGWLVLPAVVSSGNLAEMREADGATGLALIEEAVGGHIEELCGSGYRANGPTRQAGDKDGSEPLVGGNGVRALGRAYVNVTGWNQVREAETDGEVVPALTRSGGRWEPVRIRQCQGLVVGIALRDVAQDDLSLCFVPASHKSEMPTPASVLVQAMPCDCDHILERPALKAGDVVLAPSATLHGLRSATSGSGAGAGGALLLAEYISASAPLSLPPRSDSTAALPDWADELSETERAVLGAGTGDRNPPTILDRNAQIVCGSMCFQTVLLLPPLPLQV